MVVAQPVFGSDRLSLGPSNRREKLVGGIQAFGAFIESRQEGTTAPGVRARRCVAARRAAYASS